jgi:hypothetical protein
MELKIFPEEHVRLAHTHHNIGVTLLQMGKTAKALTEEEKVLSIILKKQQTIHYSIIFKNF